MLYLHFLYLQTQVKREKYTILVFTLQIFLLNEENIISINILLQIPIIYQ